MRTVLLNKEYYDRLHSMIPEEYYRGLDRDEYYCIGLVNENNTLLGVAVVMDYPNGVEIIWLCATKEYLGHAFIDDLINSLASHLASTDPNLKIYASFPKARLDDENNNKSIVSAYKSFEKYASVIADEEGGLYCIDCEEVLNLPLRKAYRSDKNCIMLCNAMSWQINDMQNRMREDERDVPIGKRFNVQEYDPNLSMLYCEDKKVMGAFLVSSDGDDIDVSLAWSISKTALVTMMLSSINELEIKYPGAKKIYIPTINVISNSLVEKLFPMAEKKSNRKVIVDVNSVRG